MTLSAIAFVPSPPLLLRDLGGGPADLRAACAAAVSVLIGDVLVVGTTEQTGWCEGDIDATPYGGPGPAPRQALPLPHSVGATLLGTTVARFYGVAPGGRIPDGDVSLLVVADGTAKRSDKAPGAFDPRAERFDGSVEQALRTGDLQALLDLDAALAAELMVGGLPAWQAAAAAAQGAAAWSGEVLYADAPYGVGYLVATWLPS